MSKIRPVYCAADVSPEWMTQVLRASALLQTATVTDVQFQTCGTGQLGDSYRFSLSYEPTGAGPATVVGKFASADATSREFGRTSGYYRNEIGFYQELAPGLTMSIPRPIHAHLDDNATDFVLLMEDLAPARAVDQIKGCNADESARVLEQAAALHAASWHDAKLAQQQWLKGPVNMFTQVSDNFAQVLETFPELCGDLVPEADLQEARKLIPLVPQWKAVFSEPQCLWHSDLRADNVLFDTQDGTHPVTVLDWQGLGFGRGTIDVAHWMGTSMEIDARRNSERDLIKHYHQCLLGNGVSNYSAEQCWNDYRLQAIHALQVGVFGLGAVKRTERGDQMWKVWIQRAAAQVRDLESFDLLAKRDS